VLQKAAVDLIIAEYPDGLPVPGISEVPRQIPAWNKQVQNFIKFTIGFCQGYLHDDGALLLFYPDNVQIKKEVLSFLYNNNLVAHISKGMPETPRAQGGPRSDTGDLWRRW
jgi:hypothetical protein